MHDTLPVPPLPATPGASAEQRPFATGANGDGRHAAIRALVFDFDGVILDTEASMIRAYVDVHKAHGFTFDVDGFLHSVGHDADYPVDPWVAFGPAADREALENIRRRHSRAYDLELPVLPGVLELLDACRRQGLRLGVASNSTHPHVDGHLQRLGLLQHFDCIACREDASAPKPAPDLYQLVLDRLGLQGGEAVAVEDSHVGSLAAKRAGLHCLAVPNDSTASHDFSHADLVLPSLAGMSLESLCARFVGRPPQPLP